MSSAGLPESAIDPAIPGASEHSQPSESTSTPPIFGFCATRIILRCAPVIGETVAPASDDRVIELPGDATGDFLGADDGEEDEEAIADADLPVCALVALNRGGAEIDWSVDSDGHWLPCALRSSHQ